jgi:hypothetical protein
VRKGLPTRPSDSPFRLALPTRPSDSPFRLALPTRPSDSPFRLALPTRTYRRSHCLRQIVDTLRDYAVTQVACGGLHTAALSANGEVLTWGLGKDGRLGHGNELDQLAPRLVAHLSRCRNHMRCCTLSHVTVLRLLLTVYCPCCCSCNCSLQQSHGAALLTALLTALFSNHMVQLFCGGHHTAALTREGRCRDSTATVPFYTIVLFLYSQEASSIITAGPTGTARAAIIPCVILL